MKHSITRTALAHRRGRRDRHGCGNLVERATEEAVERAVEEAAESEGGGNVDVEFTDDGISVQSDDGDFSFNVDENGVEIDGTDADGNDFSVDADEGGINAEGGDGTFDLDSDGTFTGDRRRW